MNFFSSALLLVLAALLVVVYRPDFSRNKFLALLRLGVIVVAALIAGGAVCSRVFTSPATPGALLLVDRTQSIGLENKKTELAALLNRQLVGRTVSTEYWAFADSAAPLKNQGVPDPTGARTDLGTALGAALRRKPGAVVLLSDGWHNAGPDPLPVAARLGIPVYAVGLGREPARDVLVRRVLAPRAAYLKDTVTVLVRLESFGFHDDRATVRLSAGPKIVGEQRLDLAAAAAEREIPFTVVPAAAGRSVYTVTVEKKPGEDNYENNRRDFSLDVRKRRLQVLYLSNEPTPNSRFLKSALAGTDIDYIPVVALVGGRYQRLFPDSAVDFSFPDRLDCDCLILDNIDGTRFDRTVTAAVTNYARTGGVLVLGGPQFRPGALAPLLPFVPTGALSRRAPLLAVAPDGAASPLFFDRETNLLADVPPFDGANAVRGLNPGARLLAWDAKSRTPLVGLSGSGTGRILEFTFFPLWRWELALAGVGPTQSVGATHGDVSTPSPFKKFILNCLFFLSVRDDRRFRLSLDKPQYFSGEDLNVTFEARTLTGAPLSGLDASVSVAPGDRSFPMTERTDGVYETRIPGLAPGAYQLTARGLRDGKPAGSAAAPATVLEQSLELLDTGRNAWLLRRIAALSGGRYYDAESLPAAGIPVAPAPRARTVRFAPQTNPFFYLAFALLFGLELFLRKRKGLP